MRSARNVDTRQLTNAWFPLSQPCLAPPSSLVSGAILAQMELWNEGDSYDNKVYTLPRHLDEKVAALHLAKVGATLSQLNSEQAAYIGVEQQGPFKGDQYRY